MTARSLPPNETEPYVENVQHQLEVRIRNHDKFYRSLEFASDPGDFICDPSKVVAHVCDDVFYGSVDG